jgi:hypothetical protein
MVVSAGLRIVAIGVASLLCGMNLGRDSSASKAWTTTQGKILTSRVVLRKVMGDRMRWAATFFYSYRGANGRQYEGSAAFWEMSTNIRFVKDLFSEKKAQELVQHNPPGTEIAVIYDPERPENSALPGNPSMKPIAAFGPLASGTSSMRVQYPGPESDYVVQWYALHDTPAYWGSLSANSGILTCVRCSRARPLGPCPNCGYEQQFFRTEGDENWIPHSTSVGVSQLEGVEGYVRCHNCRNAWHFWTCECGTTNNIRQSMGWKEHITVESPKVGSSCFIATAAYGTEQAKEVQILRTFRDERLRNWEHGTALIRAYEKVSPPLANWISDKPIVRSITRAFLLIPVIWGVNRIMKETTDNQIS